MKHKQILSVRDISRHIRLDLAAFGLRPADSRDIPAARDLAARLIGPEIVSAESLARVQQETEAALFLAEEDGAITGVLAFVLLNQAGLRAVFANAFDATAPASEHVASGRQVVAALYGWGVAATTKPSAQRLIEGSRAMGRSSVAHLRTYARPTTEAGHRLMRERMSFVDLPGSDGLVWAPAYSELEAAAA